MFKNILLITRRTLQKNKTYTFVNVFGLTIGIAAYILISAYVNFEKSYDTMHTDAKGIYRVESSFYKNGTKTDDWATSTNGYATAMKQNFPEIASIARINWNFSERVVRYNNIKYREEHVCFADTNFFTFFSYPILRGNPKTVLKDVNTMVVSQSAAQKYFGKADPIGKFMEMSTQNGTLNCMVTGVFKDLPKNSTMQFNFLISWVTQPLFFRDFWYIHESYTFLKLKPGVNPLTIENKFPALAERFKTAAPLKDLKWAISLVPLTDIHLNPAKQYEIEPKGNRNAVKYMGIIAYIILLLACVNYVNLSTAKAVDRAREVGIRKVSGANTAQLLLQFFFEALMINGAALLLGIGIVAIAATYMGSNWAISLLFNAELYIKVGLVFISSVLLSGVYPALLLSNLKPVSVLKGKYSFSKGGVLLRKGMVAFQFAASLLLIAGTFAVYRQIVYMNRERLGVNIAQTVVIKSPVNTPNYQEKVQSFKQMMLGMPGVIGVTTSGSVPGKAVGEFIANRRYGAPKNDERPYEMLKVDHDFIKTYDLKTIAGRPFDKGRPADSTGVVLNQSAVAQFGFKSAEEAIGQKVLLEGNEAKPNLVIGVVQNYHQQSLQQSYTPLILFMDPNYSWIPSNYYSVKFNGHNQEAILSSIKSSWANYFPESSLNWFFLDDFYNKQYVQDMLFGKVFLLFSSLAILIACMGLFGLTAYSTSRRIKEIGVRKVLGASVGHIISLLTWDVVKLVILSSLIGLPLAYFAVDQWLHSYAFRVSLTWWQFLVPVLTLVMISVTTIGLITFRAAVANPVKSLRDE